MFYRLSQTGRLYLHSLKRQFIISFFFFFKLLFMADVCTSCVCLCCVQMLTRLLYGMATHLHGYTCFFFVWWYRVSEHFLGANVYLDFTIWASSSLHKVKILSSNPLPGCVSLFLVNVFSMPTVTSIFTAASIVFIWLQSLRHMPTWRPKTVWRPFESL